MMNKFLLYIDILGFSNLVQTNSEKVKIVYEKVNNLHVHKHGAFQTIIFSDTILVYNRYESDLIKDKQYTVMFMVEFVQDLLYRGNSIGLSFRAIITYGEFEHYKLENIECYYGKALISAYQKEKTINGVGLFVDKELEKYNQVFKSCKYNKDLNFIFLLQTILRLKDYTGEELPIDKFHIEATDEFWLLKDDVEILKKYYHELSHNEDPRVRSKYLQTYQYYKSLIPIICDKLEKNDFSMTTINSKVNWYELEGYKRYDK